ncbi:MAG: hypothetical protein AYK19_11290 [Theionarchaea archaeon DG-70-1]|nr:MAG: hypothetical protein AYK19_11290 [Theionarchaea archaeon DG-70-1]
MNGRKIALALADDAHDNKDSFNHLKEKDITSGIKLRKNASTRSRGSPYRAQCARELKKIGYKAGKRSTVTACAGHLKGSSQQSSECSERI